MAFSATAQQLSYSDPAISYQRILLEKSGEGTFQQIGNFKVTGTSFLYGGNQKGNIYTPKEKAESATISYNTYNQQVHVLQQGQDKELVMALKEVDSFELFVNDKSGTQVLNFINGTLKDPSRKLFMQVVYGGPRFSLYKSYTSTLGYVSTNYVQSDLRQFDLLVDYYYSDNAKPGLKKLRLSAKAIKAEFKDIADLTEILNKEDFEKNTELALKEIFALLNTK